MIFSQEPRSPASIFKTFVIVAALALVATTARPAAASAAEYLPVNTIRWNYELGCSYKVEHGNYIFTGYAKIARLNTPCGSHSAEIWGYSSGSGWAFDSTGWISSPLGTWNQADTPYYSLVQSWFGQWSGDTILEHTYTPFP